MYLQRFYVVKWLVSRKTAAVSSRSVYTIQPRTMSRHFMQSHIRMGMRVQLLWPAFSSVPLCSTRNEKEKSFFLVLVFFKEIKHNRRTEVIDRPMHKGILSSRSIGIGAIQSKWIGYQVYGNYHACLTSRRFQILYSWLERLAPEIIQHQQSIE